MWCEAGCGVVCEAGCGVVGVLCELAMVHDVLV